MKSRQCELCRKETLDFANLYEIILFNDNTEKWNYIICPNCVQAIESWFASKASDGINELIAKDIKND